MINDIIFGLSNNKHTMKKLIVVALVLISFTSCAFHQHKHVLAYINPSCYGLQRTVTNDWCDWSVGEIIRYTNGQFYKVVK